VTMKADNDGFTPHALAPKCSLGVQLFTLLPGRYSPI